MSLLSEQSLAEIIYTGATLTVVSFAAFFWSRDQHALFPIPVAKQDQTADAQIFHRKLNAVVAKFSTQLSRALTFSTNPVRRMLPWTSPTSVTVWDGWGVVEHLLLPLAH